MRSLVVGLVLIFCSGCSSEQAGDQPQNPQSRRARDSAIAESNLPGARGVRGAMRVADSVAARNARIDSAGRTP